jgi:hypothetical protein
MRSANGAYRGMYRSLQVLPVYRLRNVPFFRIRSVLDQDKQRG